MEQVSPVTVVLHATACVCPVTGAAGWAVTATGGPAEARRAGAFRGPVRDPAAAEMAALANGLAAALAAGAVPPGSTIVIRSACAEVRTRVTDDPDAPSDPRIGRAVGWIREAALAGGWVLSVDAPVSVPQALADEARRRMQGSSPTTSGGGGTAREPGALGAVLDAWTAGECPARRVRSAVAAVADRQRRDPAAWARCCERVGLSRHGLWAMDPARAERETAGISGDEIASRLMGSRDPRAVLAGWLRDGDFPEDPRCLQAAAAYLPVAAPEMARAR